MRPELQYQEKYIPSNGSCQSSWNGSAITVGGGYVWNDVYAFAAKHGRIAVGGDSKVSLGPLDCVDFADQSFSPSALSEATSRVVVTVPRAITLAWPPTRFSSTELSLHRASWSQQTHASTQTFSLLSGAAAGAHLVL